MKEIEQTMNHIDLTESNLNKLTLEEVDELYQIGLIFPIGNGRILEQ